MTKLSNVDSWTAPSPTMDALCKDLVQGLHAAAQPLTILKASLDPTNHAEQSTEEMRRLLKQSAKEVDRLCLLFNYLQQFVAIESTKAESEIQNLPNLLTHTIEGIDLLFIDAGVRLVIEDIEQLLPFALLDSSRFEYALSTILLIALGLATKGDEIFVTSSSPGDFIQVRTRQPLSAAHTMGADNRLSMALAAANLRSQGAALTWQENPLTVHIALPVTTAPVLA
jgi:hypothetical protein